MGVRSCGKTTKNCEYCTFNLTWNFFEFTFKSYVPPVGEWLDTAALQESWNWGKQQQFNWKQEKSICSLFNTSLNLMYSYLHKNFNGAQLSLAPLRHFHISHNVPYLPSPSQILHNLCFSFLLGNTAVPRGIEDNACAKFGCVGEGGSNKVHYGKCESGVYS